MTYYVQLELEPNATIADLENLVEQIRFKSFINHAKFIIEPVKKPRPTVTNFAVTSRPCSNPPF